MNGKINFGELHELSLKLSKEPPLTAENIYVDLLLTLTIEEIQSEFGFVLKGGTALIKTWMSPYRFSYDLDFSYFSKGHPRKQYKAYQKQLEERVGTLGFNVVNEGSDKHREGGRIFVLKLMDKAKYLKIPVKLSVSSVDESPCFDPVKAHFKPVAEISDRNLGLLYPSLIPRLNKVDVMVLTLEELCAEKIRALATRGPKEGWSLLLRDVFDLYVMDERGVLGKVLSETRYRNCIKHKFLAIEGTGYWYKFLGFMEAVPDVKIRDEDLSIFFKPEIINEKKAGDTIEKVRAALKEILPDVRK